MKIKHRHITVIGAPAKPAPCSLCGKLEELRPYGPGGKAVCFDCMMKDEDVAKARFGAIMNGTNPDAAEKELRSERGR